MLFFCQFLYDNLISYLNPNQVNSIFKIAHVDSGGAVVFINNCTGNV